MAAPALEIVHLPRPRLEGALDLRFEPGRITALAGAAGSGKTALMRILAGSERSAAGHITLDGVPIGRFSPNRRGFGVVRQHDRLFPYTSLAGNVAQKLRLRRLGRRERQAMLRGALELAQLEEAADLRPHEADPGQIARTLLARAAVLGPAVLLLDEPFAGADESQLAGLVSTLLRFHDTLGATTVFATRHLKQALPLASDVVVIRDDAVVQSGSPRDVYERPVDALVAALAGECNCLAGTVQAVQDDMATILLACGPVVEARGGPGLGLAPGSPCRLVLRPEHVAVAPTTAVEMGDGALDATFLEAQFWGETTRLRLLIGSGAELLVRRPSAAGLRGLSPGRPMAVAWQSHHAVAFREDE